MKQKLSGNDDGDGDDDAYRSTLYSCGLSLSQQCAATFIIQQSLTHEGNLVAF